MVGGVIREKMSPGKDSNTSPQINKSAMLVAGRVRQIYEFASASASAAATVATAASAAPASAPVAAASRASGCSNFMSAYRRLLHCQSGAVWIQVLQRYRRHVIFHVGCRDLAGSKVDRAVQDTAADQTLLGMMVLVIGRASNRVLQQWRSSASK